MANNTNKTICFGNFTNIFSIKKVFIINKNLLLKLKEMQHQVRKHFQYLFHKYYRVNVRYACVKS